MSINKNIIMRIGISFVFLLLFITFFSNTIYDFNLAGVVVDYPIAGALSRTAESEGIVDFAEKDTYYAGYSGKISLFVEEGEIVTEGTELYSVVSDLEDLEKSLAAYETSGKTITLRLEKTKEDILYAQESLNNLKIEDVYETKTDEPDTSEYDYEMSRIQLSMSAIENDLKGLQILYNNGVIPKKDVDEKQTSLDNLNLQYQQQYEKKQKAIEDYKKTSENDSEFNQKNTDKAISAYEERKRELEKNIADFEYQIKEYELEISANRQEILRLREQIAQNGRTSIFSNSEGIVKQINEKVDTGTYINKNEPVMKIGNTGKAFKITFMFPYTVNYLNVGDKVTFNIKSRNLYSQSGNIKRLIMEDGALKAEVHFFAQDISGGEVAKIKIHDTSDLYEFILPNSAIRADSVRDYVLYAEMTKGLLGNEYYARRVNVSIELQDDYNAAVRIFSTDTRLPIIINTDKAISEGDRIRIVGGSDLVEIR